MESLFKQCVQPKIKLFFVLITMASAQLQAQTLRKVWESDTLLSKPESAVYDQVSKMLYVSNINGKYCVKDGNGFISKLNLKGEIVDLKWVDGLDSPQGLALFNEKLFVADVDNILEIDTRTAKVIKKYKVENAIFLNDAASDANGTIFISDCKKNKIHQLQNGQVTVWSSDSLLKSPNGLLCSGKKLFLLNMGNGSTYKIDRKIKMLREFSSGIKNCDGITSDGKDGFFVSGAWQGEVYYLNRNGEKKLVLDLGNEKTIAADITYIPKAKMLLVPTLYKTVQAYSWDNEY